MGILGWIMLLGCLQFVALSNPGCVIELECRECVPDSMPLVESHTAAAGKLHADEGDELLLVCRQGKFMQYPQRDRIVVVCEGGRYRMQHDNVVRHLLELGCQDNIFEDVLHDVDYCVPPYQGRAYQTMSASGTRHLAALCFDADRALPLSAHASTSASVLPPHREPAALRSLLGNFNQLFDARTRVETDQLYSDETRLNRRVSELVKHDGVSLADQVLTAGVLLSPHYFEDQDMRVADFPSNRVAVWRGVARGNLHHLQSDTARLLARARAHDKRLDVWAGTHGVMSLRTDTAAKSMNLFLKPGRFPVPKYLWTVVHDPLRKQAIALVLLNDPFVAVSEIRASVFCESACARVPWLKSLLRNRNYECPVYGLIFCCNVHEFSNVVSELPRSLLANTLEGTHGLLTDFVVDNNKQT